MMAISSTVETADTIQSKEPLHFSAHEVSTLVTHKTLGIIRGRIGWPSPTGAAVMTTLKANATDNTFGKVLTIRALTIDMARNATTETDSRLGTRSHVMICSTAQRA
jgi:hypothetical protein